MSPSFNSCIPLFQLSLSFFNPFLSIMKFCFLSFFFLFLLPLLPKEVNFIIFSNIPSSFVLFIFIIFSFSAHFFKSLYSFNFISPSLNSLHIFFLSFLLTSSHSFYPSFFYVTLFFFINSPRKRSSFYSLLFLPYPFLNFSFPSFYPFINFHLFQL